MMGFQLLEGFLWKGLALPTTSHRILSYCTCELKLGRNSSFLSFSSVFGFALALAFGYQALELLCLWCRSAWRGRTIKILLSAAPS